MARTSSPAKSQSPAPKNVKREPKADAPPVTVMTVTQPLAPNTTGCAPMAPFVGGTFTLGGPAALPNGEASGDPK